MKRGLVLGMAVTMATATGSDRGRAESFDSAAWKAQAGALGRDNGRADLVQAALERMRPGMTRDQVRDLLGAPDEDYGSEWVYVLGAGLIGWEYRLMVVGFDGDRVVSAREDHSETYTRPPR